MITYHVNFYSKKCVCVIISIRNWKNISDFTLLTLLFTGKSNIIVMYDLLICYCPALELFAPYIV